jgi:hypothetical protein
MAEDDVSVPISAQVEGADRSHEPGGSNQDGVLDALDRISGVR